MEGKEQARGSAQLQWIEAEDRFEAAGLSASLKDDLKGMVFELFKDAMQQFSVSQGQMATNSTAIGNDNRNVTQMRSAFRPSVLPSLSGQLPDNNISFSGVPEMSAPADSGFQGQSFAMSCSGIRQEEIRLPKFSGEFIDWPLFITTYDRTTAKYRLSNDENLARLRKSLHGKAMDLVKNHLPFPNAVPSIIETLRRKYGHPNKIIKTLRNELQDLPKVNDNLNNLLLLLSKVEGLYFMIVSCDLKEYLTNPDIIEEIEDKMPTSMYSNWRRFSKQDGRNSLTILYEWLKEEADLVADRDEDRAPIKERKGNLQRKDKIFFHKQVENNSRNQSNGFRNNTCILKCDENHKLTKCPKYAKFSDQKRLNVLSEFRLCWKCLQKHRVIA